MSIVYIRRNSDGVVRDYKDDWPWEKSNSGVEYQWADGNYSCDCNRKLFFCRAANEPEEDIECGDSAYDVRITDDAGKEIYADDRWSKK